MIVICLDKAGCCAATDIAKTVGLSRRFVLKILNGLKKAGIVAAVRGKKGGFKPAKELSEITLFDIVSPFDNLGRYENYLKRESRCASGDCPMHEFWSEITSKVLGKLHSTTLADIANHYRAKGNKPDTVPWLEGIKRR